MPLTQVREVATTCPYCGTGCGQTLQVEDGRVVGARGHADWPSSQGALCVKGRYAYDFVQSPDRLTRPLIRRHKEGELEPVSWEEALTFAGTRLAEIRARYGPESVGAAASSRCTNEDSYVLTKLMRAVLGSNHIDNCQRN
jgi:formate dehydrogenase alpha subunit